MNITEPLLKNQAEPINFGRLKRAFGFDSVSNIENRNYFGQLSVLIGLAAIISLLREKKTYLLFPDSFFSRNKTSNSYYILDFSPSLICFVSKIHMDSILYLSIVVPSSSFLSLHHVFSSSLVQTFISQLFQ